MNALLKSLSFLALFALAVIGSPSEASAATTAQQPPERVSSESWPGGNRKARRISNRARRRTLFKTRGSAIKTMLSRKRQGKKFKRASKQGFNKADKSSAPPKKVGCNG